MVELESGGSLPSSRESNTGLTPGNLPVRVNDDRPRWVRGAPGMPVAPFPSDERRCTSWKSVCVCTYRFKASDTPKDKKKANHIKSKEEHPVCPVCGRYRIRCLSYRVGNSSTCQHHGGHGVRITKGINPCLKHLDDEAIPVVTQMVEDDDTSLKWEFHVLRYYFAEAMAQFETAVRLYGQNNHIDLIGEGSRLTGMVDRLSAVAEKRAKLREIIPPTEQLIKVQFDDPRVKYLLKEAIRDVEIQTIKRVLAVLLETVDPRGEIGLARLIPTSFTPYLPAPKEVIAEVENVVARESGA